LRPQEEEEEKEARLEVIRCTYVCQGHGYFKEVWCIATPSHNRSRHG